MAKLSKKELAKLAGNPYEEDEQAAVFAWIRANEHRCEALHYAYCSLGGIRLSMGLRVKAAKQGNRPGVLDIVIPARSADGEFCGLYIDIKRLKGSKTSAEQIEEVRWLRSQGYCADIRKGHDSAIALIKEYFQI